MPIDFSKYFKPGHKILLRPLSPNLPEGCYEALTAYIEACQDATLELRLPYRLCNGESYPFESNTPFEFLSDAFGLGVRVTGAYQSERAPDLVSFTLHEDLEVFQRTLHDRRDVTIGVRYTKGQGALRTFREQWEKNVQILAKSKGPAKIPDFPRCAVNISSGGIRFAIKAPIAVADICLLLLDIGDKRQPICTLAEVVWMEEKEQAGRRVVGMQFLNILEDDRKRLESFVKAKPQG